MEYLITLVNGTFAKNAPWTREGSDFCKRITEEFEKQNNKVDIYQFSWDGRNSNFVRGKESERFSQILKDQITNHPNKKKVIIAHSHGGNVAMYALKNLAESASEYQLVTLAAPFLNLRKRTTFPDLEVLILDLQIQIWLIAFLLLFFTANMFSPLEFYTTVFPSTSLFVMLAHIILLIGIAFIPAKLIGNMLSSKAESLPEKIDEVLYNYGLENQEANYPILAVIDYSDEVKIWFGTLYRLWEIPFNLNRLFRWLSKWSKKIIIVFSILTIVTAITKILLNLSELVWLFVFGIVGIAYIVAISAYFLGIFILLVIPLISLVIKSNPLVLGWESLIYQIFIRTIPAVSPLGYKNLYFIQYANRNNKHPILNHSIYEQHDVIRDISNWIQKA